MRRHLLGTSAALLFAVVGLLPAPAPPGWADSDGDRAPGSIAFSSNRDGNMEIYAMNADGTDVRRLTDNSTDERGVAWSPDGKRLVCISEHERVCVLNADGSGYARVSPRGMVATGASWLLDGRILFVAFNNRGSGIYAMKSDGSGLRLLLGNDHQLVDAVCSPDGRRILFTVSENTGWRLYLARADGTDAHPVASLPKGVGDPAWCLDGKRIAFTRSEQGIWLAGTDGRGLNRLPGAPDNAASPAWSPDGKRILFSTGNRFYSSDDGEPAAIYSIRLDGSGKTLLAGGDSDNLCPVCSAFPLPPAIRTIGGSTLAEAAFRAAPWRLQIPVPGRKYPSRPRPEAFSSETPPRVFGMDGGLMLWVSGLSGEGARSLGKLERISMYDARFSPDGRYLAYTAVPHSAYNGSAVDRASEIWVTDVRDGRRSVIAGSAKMPEWGSDSREVFFWQMETAPAASAGSQAPPAAWRVYRATAPWDHPQVTAASTALVAAPTAIAPGGSRFAYLAPVESPANDERLRGRPAYAAAVEPLVTGESTRFLLPFEFQFLLFMPHSDSGLSGCYWSGDGRWIVLHLQLSGLPGIDCAWLLDTATGRFIDLSKQADQVMKASFPAVAQEHAVQIERIAWLPRDNRLLLYAMAGEFGGCRVPPDPPPLYWRWLLYDPQSGRMAPVGRLFNGGPCRPYCLSDGSIALDVSESAHTDRMRLYVPAQPTAR